MILETRAFDAYRLRLAEGKLILDKRKEGRYPTNDPAEVGTVPSSGARVPATVIDVSKSGLRLEVSVPFLAGTRIEIVTSSHKLVVFGEVRHCRRVGKVFHVGVLIEGIVSPRAATEEHVSHDLISLYILGKGLTVPQVLRVKDHLSKCDLCSSIAKVRAGSVYRARPNLPLAESSHVFKHENQTLNGGTMIARK